MKKISPDDVLFIGFAISLGFAAAFALLIGGLFGSMRAAAVGGGLGWLMAYGTACGIAFWSWRQP